MYYIFCLIFFLTGAGLALKGTMMLNHDILMRNLSIIGTDDDALYCVTDDVTCCGTLPSPGDGGRGNGRGYWYYPRTIGVLTSSTDSDRVWYTSWLTGAVLMNYRDDIFRGVTGLFHCEIQDSTGTTHQLYTCIYSTEDTECKSLVIYIIII